MQPKDRRLVTEQVLEDGVENLNGRIEAVETMAGLTPGEVTDAQTASVVRQTSTQTRSALDQIIDAQLSPIASTAGVARSLAVSNASRVDAMEVLTETVPGNVDDATIALHYGQPSSRTRQTIDSRFLSISTNLFDKDAVTEELVYLRDSGTPSSHERYNISDWIPIQEGMIYTYGGDADFPVERVTYFDEDFEYIDDFSFSSWPMSRTAPEGTRWARLSVHRNSLDTAQMNAGEELLPYEPFGDGTLRPELLPKIEPDDIGAQPAGDYLAGPVAPEDTTFFSRSSNLLDDQKTTTGYRLDDSTGDLVEGLSQTVTDWISVTPNTAYTFAGVEAPARFVFYTSEREALTSDLVEPSATFVTDAHTHWVRLNYPTTEIVAAQLNEGTQVLPYEPGGYKLDVPVESPRAVKYVLDSDALGQVYTAPPIPEYSDLQSTTVDDVYGWYDNLMASHPDYVTRTDLGTASDGQHIYAYTFKAPEVPVETLEFPIPVALILSGVHGYEKNSVWHIWRFVKALCEEWADNPVLDAIRWNIELVIVPVANPYSYDSSVVDAENVRKNANGVDIARNFSANWTAASGEPGTSTYPGTDPMSEPETVILDTLMSSVQDRAVFGVSVHTFSTPPEEPWKFLWAPGLTEHTMAHSKRLISRMSRKWKAEQSWITDPNPYYGYANYATPGGNETQQMEYYGIPCTTFEVSRIQLLDSNPNPVRHSTEAMTLGYEATVNYIALGIKAGIDRLV